MTSLSSYQPFLIGEGKSKTGLFQYLDSWVKPGDAYDILQDAYIFRGSLYKRQGMSLYPSNAGNGSLVYGAGDTIQTGDGMTVAWTVNTLKAPVIAGSVKLKASVSGVILSATDDGAGSLSGTLINAGFTHTINYTTGALVFTTNGAVDSGFPIVAIYSYAPKYLTLGGPVNNPIMGIKNFINELNNNQILVVMDTQRASWYDFANMTFQPMNTISEQLGIGNGSSTTQIFTPPWTTIVPYTVSISDGVNTITDKGNGTFTTAGNMVGPNTITYATGAISLGLTSANTRVYTWTATLGGAYFTGNNTNFFNTTNWKPTDSSTSALFMTNNVDQVTVWNGTNLSRPPFYINFANIATGVNQIQTTLDVKVYKNSLIFIRPTLVAGSVIEAQTIRSSIPSTSPSFTVNNFVSDVSGNGQATVAPTGDWIMSSQFLRDILVVFFLNSTWIFRFTGSAFDAFRFDQVNNSKSTQAPYGSIAYDLRCTSMGNKGLIFCDGTNVDRYDIAVIDQYLDIEPKAFQQCYGQRFDILQQAWMLYPEQDYALGAATQLISNRALVYNFLEETWAKFNFNLGVVGNTSVLNSLSCLGQGFTTEDLTWSSFAANQPAPAGNTTWQQWEVSWDGYLNLGQQLALLGGDQNGFVYQLNTTTQDNANPIYCNILTHIFNPFVQTGEKGRFGYLDVYYELNSDVVLTFSFFINNSTAASITRNITLDGNANQNTAWKRIYLNGIIGEFLQIGITDNGVGTFKILGMILHAMPAGRLTPGGFL